MPPSPEEVRIDQEEIEDRLASAEESWEGVAGEIGGLPLDESQRRELERRAANSIPRPDAVTPWEVVKVESLARVHR